MSLRDSTRMLRALRYPQYRRFWFGNLAAVSGQQMMWLAQGWLVYDITGSALYLGYAGLATALPAILLNLVGGVLADRLDQRKVIFVTQVITGLSVLVLATLTAFGLVEVWHVLVIAFISGATQAFNNPARQSIFPQLIDRSELMNAVSLNSIIWQGTRVVAPTAAGLIVAFAGTAFTFYVCAVGFLPLGFIALSLKVEQQTPARRDTMLKDLGEGIGFIRDNFIFAFLIGMSFFNSFFGMAAQQLLPAFARDVLDLAPLASGCFSAPVGSARCSAC
jgi:Transmembrane secretion effector